MSMILQTPRLTPPPLTNLSSSSSSLNLLFLISRVSLQTPNFPATKTPPIQMRGGPRTYPGGLNKYQWRRVRPLKSKKIRDAGVRREQTIYQMRRRAELRSAALELERPWEGFDRRDDDQVRKQAKFYSKRSDLGWKRNQNVDDCGDSSRPSCSSGERGSGWESDSESDDDGFGGLRSDDRHYQLQKQSESLYGSVNHSGNSSFGEEFRELESRPSCSFGERENGWGSDSETDDDGFGNLSFNGVDERGDDGVSMSNRVLGRLESESDGCLYGERYNGSDSESEIEGKFETSLSDNPVMESSSWKKTWISGEEKRLVREDKNVARLASKGKTDSINVLSNKEEKCGIASAGRGRCRTKIRRQNRGRVSRKMKFSHSGEVLNFKWDGTYDKSRTKQ